MIVSILNISNINKNMLINSFLISGSLVVFLGHLGAVSPFFNFSNNFIFGQNKRGINAIESIAGNTWRGYSASAESIGEFFGFILRIVKVGGRGGGHGQTFNDDVVKGGGGGGAKPPPF